MKDSISKRTIIFGAIAIVLIIAAIFSAYNDRKVKQEPEPDPEPEEKEQIKPADNGTGKEEIPVS